MIIFYVRAKDVGGVQVLYLNLIKELFNKNIIVKLISYKESWLNSELNRYKIKYEFLNIESTKIQEFNTFIKAEDILVSTFLMDEYFLFLKVNPLLLFWNVFPRTLYVNESKINVLRKLFRKRLINKMINNRGLVFMDNSGVNSIKNQFGISIKSEIIQIPINTSEKNLYLTMKKRKHDNIINITYLGRAEKWKVKPVIKILKDIYEYKSNEFKIIFHIITDEIEEFIKLLDFTATIFELRFYSGISGENLTRFLLEKADLHIAMGTSCLEGSGNGIPSILIDASFNDFPENYKYRWIFENENYSLGELLEDSSDIMKGHTLTEILDYYNEDRADELVSISNLCFEYTKRNHGLELVTNSFIHACFNTELRIKDVICNDIFYLNKDTVKKISYNKSMILKKLLLNNNDIKNKSLEVEL